MLQIPSYAIFHRKKETRFGFKDVIERGISKILTYVKF